MTAAGLEAGLRLASELFDRIGEQTFDGVGIARAPYGEGEQIAHDLVAEAARKLDLQIKVDAALNLAMTLRGSNPDAEQIIIGSHLDSVPRGGNFDGLAGVLAGLACLAAMRESRLPPCRSVTLMALRGEENAWFGAQHIGSRAALGLLSAATLENARRIDTGRTLAQHMAEAGADLEPIRRGLPLVDRRSVCCYLELHIEQGPLLEVLQVPVGIVTGIRGNVRCREFTCRGAYGHSGVVPRNLRKDAVVAVCDLVKSLDDLWGEIERRGDDLVLTFGRFFTDRSVHALTTIAGEVTACFEARSKSSNVLDEIRNAFLQNAHRIAAQRGVTFEFSPITNEQPVTMHRQLQEKLAQGARCLGIRAESIASGAGHDAGDFAAADIPSAMIFVRNQNGSHNPKEAMRFTDFVTGVRLMHWLVTMLDRDAAKPVVRPSLPSSC